MSIAGLLGRLGDFGLFAPLVAVALGWLLPPLAGLGHALLVPAVILMFAMSVAMVDPGRLHWPDALPVVGLALCNLLVSPLVAYGLAAAIGLESVGGWVVLVAACPAAGAASLVAGLLGLAMRPMLLAQLLCFLALPVTAPLVAGLLLDGVVVDPWMLFGRIALMVALPSLLGTALRLALRREQRSLAVRPMRGLGVLGLCGVGLAIAHGLSAKLAIDVPWAECGLGLVITSLVGAGLGGATGLLSGRLGGAPLGASFALGGAVRNVSLLWSATIGISSPEGEAVMMLGTLWTFVVPAILGLRGVRPHRRAGALACAVVVGMLLGTSWRARPPVLVAAASGAAWVPPPRPLEGMLPFEADRVAGVLMVPAAAWAQPRPAVVLLHDALGHDGRGSPYVDALLEAGIAVLDVLVHDDEPWTVARAVRVLGAHPLVAGRPVGVLGFGQGARLAALAAPGAIALLYPGCAGLEEVRHAAPPGPVMLMHGGADPANPPAACAAAVATLARGGGVVTHVQHVGAGYAWDFPLLGGERRAMLPRPDADGHIVVEPSPWLARRSATGIARFFEAALGSPMP